MIKEEKAQKRKRETETENEARSTKARSSWEEEPQVEAPLPIEEEPNQEVRPEDPMDIGCLNMIANLSKMKLEEIC